MVQVITSPDPVNSPTGATPLTCPGPDRRRWPRARLEAAIVITELDRFGRPNGSWSCHARDLGRGGVGLTSRRMVHHNRHVLIEFPQGPGRPPRTLSGIVRHSQYDHGGYILGIEFAHLEQPTARA